MVSSFSEGGSFQEQAFMGKSKTDFAEECSRCEFLRLQREKQQFPSRSFR
jgi:hypothetical protein